MVVQCDKWKNSSSTIEHSGIYNPFPLTPCSSALDFWKIMFEKSILGNYSEAIYSFMVNVEMAKYIYLQMWNCFAICKCKSLFILRGEIQSKPIYELVTYKPLVTSPKSSLD